MEQTRFSGLSASIRQAVQSPAPIRREVRQHEYFPGPRPFVVWLQQKHASVAQMRAQRARGAYRLIRADRRHYPLRLTRPRLGLEEFGMHAEAECRGEGKERQK